MRTLMDVSIASMPRFNCLKMKLATTSGAIRNIFSLEQPMNKIRHLLLGIGFILIPGLSVLSQQEGSKVQFQYGAIVRGDNSKRELALVFTGDAYADGGMHIAGVLSDEQIHASFFFTGNFYRNPGFKSIIDSLLNQGNYLGAHSDGHLLYCSWENRDSLLLTQEAYRTDLLANYRTMLSFGVSKKDAPLFLPPYEWYNDSIAIWTRDLGLQLVNYTPGTLSHADYTVPGTGEYRSSKEILHSILDYESSEPAGLNGFILLMHIGTASERTDKLYFYLEQLVEELKLRGYRFKRIDELLRNELEGN
jgi:peptidoglycan/xylan/chitin deacetylase (PgdA/CDA1 family)